MHVDIHIDKNACGSLDREECMWIFTSRRMYVDIHIERNACGYHIDKNACGYHIDKNTCGYSHRQKCMRIFR